MDETQRTLQSGVQTAGYDSVLAEVAVLLGDRTPCGGPVGQRRHDGDLLADRTAAC